jgi:hypothetical protein
MPLQMIGNGFAFRTRTLQKNQRPVNRWWYVAMVCGEEGGKNKGDKSYKGYKGDTGGRGDGGGNSCDPICLP